MRPRTIRLRGFIRKASDGAYEGICLTLNLAVRGKSEEAVEIKLRELIVAYLNDVIREGSWDEFVPRRAPLPYYAAYAWYWILSALHQMNGFKLFIETAPNCMAHA